MASQTVGAQSADSITKWPPLMWLHSTLLFYFKGETIRWNHYKMTTFNLEVSRYRVWAEWIVARMREWYVYTQQVRSTQAEEASDNQHLRTVPNHFLMVICTHQNTCIAYRATFHTLACFRKPGSNSVLINKRHLWKYKPPATTG